MPPGPSGKPTDTIYTVESEEGSHVGIIVQHYWPVGILAFHICNITLDTLFDDEDELW